jgi:lactoylglutathione lyase
MKFLHAMLRVSDPEATVAFFQLLGLEERGRRDVPQGKFTLSSSAFLATRRKSS